MWCLRSDINGQYYRVRCGILPSTYGYSKLYIYMTEIIEK